MAPLWEIAGGKPSNFWNASKKCAAAETRRRFRRSRGAACPQVRYAMPHMVCKERQRPGIEAAWNGAWRSILASTGPCRRRDGVIEQGGLPPRPF